MTNYLARIERYPELVKYAHDTGVSVNGALNIAVGKMLDAEKEIVKENERLRELVVRLAMGKGEEETQTALCSHCDNESFKCTPTGKDWCTKFVQKEEGV